MRSIPSVLLALLVLLNACRSTGFDPIDVLPPDSDAWIVMAPLKDSGKHLNSILSRLPDGAGVTDLIRSITGIDVTDVDKTRESGLDPNRGLAFAWYPGRSLLVLPVSDEALASRRLGLRLARLGFIEESGGMPDGVRGFSMEGDSKTLLGLRVASGLAFIGLGGADIGEWLASMGPSGGVRAAFQALEQEAGLGPADVIAVVKNASLVSHVMTLLHVYPSMSSTSMHNLTRFATLLGDLRSVVRFDRGIQARVTLGVGDEPLDPVGSPMTLPPGVAVAAAIDLPDYLLRLARDGLGSSGVLDNPLSAWNGRLVLSLLTDSRIAQVPLVTDDRFFNRARIAMGIGTTPDVLSGDKTMAAIADGVLRLGWRIVPLPAGALPGLTATSSRGHEVSLVSQSGFVLAVTGRDSWAFGREGLFAGRLDLLPGLKDPPGSKVLSLVADPGQALQSLGLSDLEFARHMIGALRSFDISVTWSGSRLVSDIRLVTR